MHFFGFRVIFVNDRFTVFGANEKQVDQDRHRVQRKGKDKNILIRTRLADDQIGDLVARQTRHRPRGKRDTVNGRNFTHSVHVRKKGGQVAEPAAVAEIDDDQKRNTDCRDTARDRARKQGKRRNENLADQDNFIHGISVFEVIADRRISKPSRRVKEARQRAKERRRTAKPDRHIDIFFVGNEGKSAGDVDIENQPNAEEFDVAENFEAGEECFDLKLFVFLHPAFGFFQKQMSAEHHHEPDRREDIERKFRADAVDQSFDHGREDHFRRAESRNGKPRCKTLVVLKPKHQRFDGREITKPQTDPHNHAVA